jgi:hypothetical protein
MTNRDKTLVQKIVSSFGHQSTILAVDNCSLVTGKLVNIISTWIRHFGFSSACKKS